MRELVREIDTHVELVDLEITSYPNAALPSTQPFEDIQDQLAEDAPAQTAKDTAMS